MIERIRVLMVESDPHVIELSRHALIDTPTVNFSVEHVSSVINASQRLRREPYDVLLLGIGLVESQELNTLARIRQQVPGLPIVVLTRIDDNEATRQLLEQGAQDCLLQGSMTPEVLKHSIDYAIHRQHSLNDIVHAHARLQTANESLEEEKVCLQEEKVCLLEDKVHLSQQHDMAQQMVDNVSHDFRTPLTAIKEFAGLIHDGLAGDVNPKQKEFLEIVADRVDLLALMVDDMLDISKLESGMLGVWRREYRVTELLDPIRQLLLRKAELKGIRLEFVVADDLLTVYCDGDKIGRVLVNLAVNALKFSLPGSLVQIWSRYDAQQSKLLLGVTDQGPGISKNNLERIFNRFQQLDTTTPLDGKSFGLGLTIARELVQLNLGELTVQSEVGVGSTFSFDLPLADPRLLIARYVRRAEQVRQERHVVSTLMVTIQGNPALDSSLVIDKYLQQCLRGNDLVLRVNKCAWLLLVRCPLTDVQSLIVRLEKCWEGERRNCPQGQLPALCLEHRGTRMLDGDVAVIEAELVDLFQRLEAVKPYSSKVLLVDDDRDVVSAIGIRLQANGYEVFYAYDGSAGYRAALEVRPDAIIMDVRMSGISGLTLLDKIRHSPDLQAVPVIMLSGSIRDRQRALDMGANYFLIKPCDGATLISALQSVATPIMV